MGSFRRSRLGAVNSVVLGMLAVALLASGCGRPGADPAGGPQAGGPEAALRVAVDRTLGVRTLRVVRSQEGVGESEGGTMVSEYQAPDRGRSVTSGERPTEIRVLGSTLYLSSPAGDGFFIERPQPDAGNLAVENVLLPLRALLGARNVTEVGGLFRVTGVRGTAEAQVSEGYVTSVRLRWERTAHRFDADYELSDFDADLPPIAAPPDGRIVPAAGSQPRCGPEGDQRVVQSSCTSPAPTQVRTGIELAAPVGPTESAIQIRPVISVAPLLADSAPRCNQHTTNPDPASVVRVKGKADCYELGPTESQIRRAARVEAMSRPDSGGDLSSYFTEDSNLDVRVSVVEDDAKLIAIVVDREPRAVAIVMFGRVLVVEGADSARGTFVLPDLTSRFASQVVAALTGSPART